MRRSRAAGRSKRRHAAGAKARLQEATVGETDDHNVARPAAGAAVKVSVCDADPPWSEYLGRHPQATLFHDPRWGVVMEKAYGNRPYYLTARRGEAVVGVLPLVLQRSLLFGTHLCSIPYFDAAGILADDAEAARALTEEAAGLMGRVRARWVELRQGEPLGGDLETRTDKITLRLVLPGDSEALWNGFKTKIRTQIRRAKQEDPVVLRGGKEYLADFHDVYSRLMRDLGSPPHGTAFFDQILERFPQEAGIYLMRLGEQTLAAAFALTHAGTAYLPWSASDPRFRDLRATMWLYWTMLEDACNAKATCFDFGRSTRGSGTHEFKKKWGAEEVPLHWHYVLPPGGSVPDIGPDSPKYRLAVGVWRRLPLGVVRALGPRLIAKLS